ncbi:MAG: autotransporter assembly complex family protein [Hyphomonadaceae bacterium]
MRLEGADNSILKAIAQTLPERERPATLFDAERLAEEAAGRAEAWMRSEGYYEGVADAVGEDNPPVARVKITLGQRFAFAPPVIIFESAQPDAEAAKAAGEALALVKDGAPARAGDVLAAEAAAEAALQSGGYPRAKAGQREAIVDHATGRMTVTFRFTAGDPVTLGSVIVRPEGVVSPDLVRKFAHWKEGDPYSPEALSELRRGLSGTGAFARVGVSLSDETDAQGDRHVLVRLEPAKPRTIALGASYSTTEGAGLDVEWTLRNATHRADELKLSSTLAEKEQKLAASLLRPSGAGRQLNRRYGVELAHEDTVAFARTGITVSSGVEADPDLRRALIYGVTLSASQYDKSEGIENAIVATVYGGARFDHTDAKFDPTHGYILEARIEPSAATGSATTTFVRATGGARGYWSPANRVTFAGRLNLGWVETITGSDSDLPLDRRFYAGGGGSVRGYEYRSIYPLSLTRSADEPPGGRGLVETSAEARFRFGSIWGAAAFIDGGAAFDTLSEAGDMRWGAGLGLRYNLGFAPVRLDVAAPLNKRPGDPNFAFYVSLGQAF